jgi:hypothetical protein
VNLLLSIVADVVVNATIPKVGFEIPGSYINEYSMATKIASTGQDPYLPQSSDPLFQSRFMAAKYLMAWGFLKYGRLVKDQLEVLNAFLTSFKIAFPDEFHIAEQFQVVMEPYDIFTPDGFRSAVEQAFLLWGLKDSVTEAAGT